MKKDILLQFGKVIRKKRLEKQLSQENLAELSGLHRTYIGMVERAEKNITLVNVQKISVALEVPIHELFKDIK